MEKTVNGIEPLGFIQKDNGRMGYVVMSSDYGIIHKLKLSDMKMARLMQLTPLSAWYKSFPSIYGPQAISWKEASDWLIHSCMVKGAYVEPEKPEYHGKETVYGAWVKMLPKDWFYVEDKHTFDCAVFNLGASKHKPPDAEFIFEWLDSEGRGKITRIL